MCHQSCNVKIKEIKHVVTTQTFRARHRKGLIDAVQDEGSGHRRYVIVQPIIAVSESRTTKQRIVYARVSSRKQLGDLERQITLLEKSRPGYRVVSDIGSGINFKRRGLLHVLDLAISGRLDELVVAHRDRLMRFGFELIEHILKGTEPFLQCFTLQTSKEILLAPQNSQMTSFQS